jgi:hypothetical protein
MHKPTTLVHIFIDHSNMWGSARLASRVRNPEIADDRARISVPVLDHVLGGTDVGVVSKIVSGGVPPGMEGLWLQYQAQHYDTQRLFRDEHWKERGVDHSIIGHMWRIAAKHVPDKGETVMVLASGDGQPNEFGTSFLEVVEEILCHERYAGLKVRLASFDWTYPGDAPHRSPTNRRLKAIVEESPRGVFVNLMEHYKKLVYHEQEEPPAPVAARPPKAASQRWRRNQYGRR